MKEAVCFAPGRICLFGEHSDYLNFPVQALAIDLGCTIHVRPIWKTPDDPHEQIEPQVDTSPPARIRPRTTRLLILYTPQLPKKEHSFPLEAQEMTAPDADQDPSTLTTWDFAQAALYQAMVQDHWRVPDHVSAIHCTSTTTLPLQAGCSSSTAFCVAWIQVLAYIAQRPKDDTEALRMARRAFDAEVGYWRKAPGGHMDHVTSAVGGLIRIGGERQGASQAEILSSAKTTSWHVETLVSSKEICPPGLGLWVLADSGEKKNTAQHLIRCKQGRLNLWHDLLEGDWDLPLRSSNYNDSQASRTFQGWDNPDQESLWQATMINRRTEEEAYRLWLQAAPQQGADGKGQDSATATKLQDAEDDESIGAQLGQLMTQHHEALRDGLHLSTPRLEAMNQAARAAGASGFKVVGSGGGGCGVAWAKSSDQATSIAQAMKEAGAVETWILHHPSPGAFTRVIS